MAVLDLVSSKFEVNLIEFKSYNKTYYLEFISVTNSLSGLKVID